MKYILSSVLVVVALTISGCTSPEQGGGYADTLTGVLDDAKGIAQDSYTVDYRGKNLSTFPSEVLARTHIRILDISNNQLTSLPAEIGVLTDLEELYVDNNELTGALPAEIRKMSGLKILSASNNGLTGIPAEIGQLKRLVKVDFSNNNLDTYPNELESLRDNLEVLDLSGNKYSSATLADIKNKLPNTLIVH